MNLTDGRAELVWDLRWIPLREFCLFPTFEYDPPYLLRGCQHTMQLREESLYPSRRVDKVQYSLNYN